MKDILKEIGWLVAAIVFFTAAGLVAYYGPDKAIDVVNKLYAR